MYDTVVSDDLERVAKQWGIELDKLYYCSDVKRLLDLNGVHQVYFLIKTGQLEAFKITKSWRIKGYAVARYLEQASNLR